MSSEEECVQHEGQAKEEAKELRKERLDHLDLCHLAVRALAIGTAAAAAATLAIIGILIGILVATLWLLGFACVALKPT